MARLYTDHLQVAYEKTDIVKDLNLTIPDGQITAIIGPNGCGKSTLLQAMARILPSKAGTCYLDGKDISREQTKKVAQKLAILPQSPDAPAGLTVEELVSYGRFPYQTRMGRLTEADRKAIDWALNITDVTAFRKRAIDELSGGQRQRVWIALALAQDTELILLDEPTTYLDLAHQLEVLELLRYLNEHEQRTIVMVIHDLNQAARFADYIVAMKAGRIVQEGTATDVITKQTLAEVFQIDVEIGLDPRTKKPICLTYDLLQAETSEAKAI
jgi:iron complex transport system ATP-binding protein